MAFFEFPHTRTYDSDLGWIIKRINDQQNQMDGQAIDMAELKHWMDVNEPRIDHIEELYEAFASGELPQPIVDALNEWLQDYGVLDAAKNYTDSVVNPLAVDLSDESIARAAADSNLQTQINNIVAPSGQAPSAAEVQNARIGIDGTTYPSLGDAIRTQDLRFNTALMQLGETGNFGYLTTAHEGQGLSNDQPYSNGLLSYTDYIDIPTGAQSVTVTGETKSSSQTFGLSPNMYIYDSSYNIVASVGSNTADLERTYNLIRPGAKYIRVVQPSEAVIAAHPELTKLIRFNFYDASAEDAKILTRAVTSNTETITASNYQNYFTTADNAATNTIYTIVGNITSAMISNIPQYNTNGLLITLCGVETGANIKHQAFITASKFWRRTSNYAGVWNAWATDDLYGGYLTPQNYTDYFSDANNAPLNKIFGIQAIMPPNAVANLPEYQMATQANLITLCGRDPIDGNMNALQIYSVGSGGNLYIRSSNYDRSTWSPWINLLDANPTYYIGPTRDYTSVTQFFKDHANDVQEKTVYIDGGVYDIAQEYTAANVPVIPPNGDYNTQYAPYNVWIPANTHVIGIGDVVLRYAPAAADVTEAQSKSVSPLNINRSCTIENISVEVKNGRYACHIDGDTLAFMDSVIKLKNVNLTRETNDSDRGWNEVVGIGLGARNYLSFEDCTVDTPYLTGAAFYAHNKNTTGSHTLTAGDSPAILIKDGIFTATQALPDMIRLQSRTSTNPQHIAVKIENSYIDGGIHLQAYTSGVRNCFDLTKLNTQANVVVDDATNPYPVKSY